MKLLKRLAFCFLLILGFTAVAKAEDTIYLKDGNVVHGKIIKKFPSGSVKIRTASGKETILKKTSIKKITHSDAAASTSSSASMSEKPKKTKHHMEEAAGSAINGGNANGRPGYFFTDTATGLNQGQLMGAAHLGFVSVGSQLNIPVGASYGISKNFLVNATTNFYSVSGASGLGNLILGAKLGLPAKDENFLFALGLDVLIGPLSNSPVNTLNFDPYGVATYTFNDGFQLTGKVGLYVPGGYTINTVKIPAAPAYIQLNAGAAKAFDKDLTGIAEVDINGLGSANTPAVVGLRTGHDVQLQGYAGLDLAGTVGVMIGGGVVLLSE